MTMILNSERSQMDQVTLTGILPAPIRPGAYPIAPGGAQGPGRAGALLMPACDRPGNDCSGGLRRDTQVTGSLVLEEVDHGRVSGRFEIASVRDSLRADGTFGANVTNPVGWWLPPDHPCVPECPEVERPLPNLDRPELPGTRHPLLFMPPDEFRASPEAQDALFRLAGEVWERQEAFGNSLIATTERGGRAVSILKRNEKSAFVEGVLAKAERNGYEHIGQMDDMVRGRLDLCDPQDVHDVAEILLYTLPTQGGVDEPTFVRLSKTEMPRRPVKARECACEGAGYPRYHVIVQDTETGITHEWQIGMAAVSDVYEVAGIPFPPEMSYDFEMGLIAPDLHDIDYDIFRQGVRKHDRATGQNNYEALGLEDFGSRLDELSAAANCLGYDLPDLDERIASLHREAADLLQDVVDVYGIEQVREWYH